MSQHTATPSKSRTKSSVRIRLAWMALALVLLPVVAFYIGMSVYDATECSGDLDGECDLAGLAGLVWAVLGFVGVLLIGLASEFVRAVRRRRSATG
jgi:hypothetical protein